MAIVFDSQGTGSTRTFDAQIYAAGTSVSSALAWLEASDSIAMAGSVALAPGASAIAWTEAADVVAITGSVVFVAAVPQEYFLTTISAAPIYLRSPLLENNVYSA